MIFLLIMTLIVGQACIVSFGEEPGITLENFLKISKKISKEDGTVSNDYYLGEIINVEYTITSDEVALDIPKEIAFVIDLTSSMRYVTSGSTESRLASLKRVFSQILEQWNIPNTKMCIIEFGPYVQKETDILDATRNNINNVFLRTVQGWNENNLYSGTNLGDGLRRAYYKLTQSGNPNAKKYIITLTDGSPTMRTVDRYGNPYYGEVPVKDNNIGIRNDPPTAGFDSRPYEEYACNVMRNISSSGMVTNFLIGFGIEANQASTMNNIGMAGRVAPVGDVNGDGRDDYFYRPSNGTELEKVFQDIQKSIMDPFDFTMANLIQEFPEDRLELQDDSLNDIPGEYLDLNGIDQLIPSPDKIVLPLKLTLKLKEGTINKYTLYPSEIKFTIKFRVLKTGQVDFDPILGNFLFHNPVTGEKYNVTASDTTKTIVVKQTVNSIIIPPLIVFGTGNDISTVNAFINPANGLDTSDRHLENWSVDDANNIFDIDDETPNDTSANVILKRNTHGIGKITTESSGYGYGGKDKVKGNGNVISIMPQINNISLKVGKTQEVSISSLLPDTLSIGEKDAFNKELTKIMNNYYYNQKYFSDAAEAESLDGKAYKIYPANSNDYYIEFNKTEAAVNPNATKLILGNDSIASISDGIWTIKPEMAEDGEIYYRIFTEGELSGNLTSSTNSKNVYWCTTTYRSGANKDLQLWKIELMEDGNYKITSKKTGMCIANTGSNISFMNYYGNQTQRWKIENIDDHNNSTVIDKNIQSIINNIEFESDLSGQPIATADSASSVKIAFGSDRTKLKITGKKPTVLNSKKINDGKVIVTANIIYKNPGVPGIEGHISKGTVTFEVVVNDIVDIN